MNRITKKMLEQKCNWIRKETGLNIGIYYAYGTQKIVLNGVYEKGYTGSKNISLSGTKKEIANILDSIYNFILETKNADSRYRLDE